MPIYQTALERILPFGSNVYVALLVTPPDLFGLHEAEPIYTGYARVAHSGWTATQDSLGRYIANSSSIVFNPVAGSAVTVYAWGIYLTSTGGSLLAGGLVRNGAGTPQPQYLGVGDQARFLIDSLKIRSGN